MPDVYIQMKKKITGDIKPHPFPTFARSLETRVCLLPRIRVGMPTQSWAWGLCRGSGGGEGASVPIVCEATGASLFLGCFFSCKQ